jgi:hypothetical protein
MRVIVLLLTVAMLSAGPASAAGRDSFLLVADGKSVANGAPTNVKAIKAQQSPPFFWFTLEGKQYITRDPAALRQIKQIHRPLFSLDNGNENDYAAKLPELNRSIEGQLHDLTIRLVREGAATELKK